MGDNSLQGLIDKANKVINAAKLSTEQRKKLGKGTFCGPGRSLN